MKTSACFNIGRKEKKKRIFAGIVSFAAAAALAIYFVFHESSFLYRLFLFPLFFLSVLCFLQAKEKTCVYFAFQRERVLDEGRDKIQDPELCRLLLLKSQKILFQTLILSAALTFLTCIS